MTAEIYLTRAPGEVEHSVTVIVKLDANNEVEAIVAEDVEEREITRRFGDLDYQNTGDFLYREGDLIGLDGAEEAAARKAIASNQAAWEQLKAGIHGHLKPEPKRAGGKGL